MHPNIHTYSKILEKLPKVPLREAYRNAVEFRTLEELDNISTDMDAMRIQSLLICERILGISHKDTLFRLTFRGASYADSLQLQRCIQLWTLLLEVRVQHNTLLHFDTCFAAQALVRLMLELHERNTDLNESNSGNVKLPYFKDVLAVFKLLTETVAECHALLQIRPISRRQQENFDSIFKCIAHAIYLLIATSNSHEESRLVYLSVRKLVQANITSACTNDSLLHLCVSRLNVIKSGLLNDENLNVSTCPPFNNYFNVCICMYFLFSFYKVIFPNASVIKLLLNCGMNVNAKNEVKSTALHIAAQPYNFSNEVRTTDYLQGWDIFCHILKHFESTLNSSLKYLD